MKKTMLAVLVSLMLSVSVAMAGGDETEGAPPDQAYFDQKFGELQKGMAEVKGDTTQIVSILGNVFEGTVPRGGTLTGLCNQHGWNLIVVMGHNGISDPNTVATGATFAYPKTAEEFQAALKKGKPLYDAWLSKQKTTFRVNRVKVDTAEIDTLRIRVMNVTEKLKIKDMEVDTLRVRLAEVTEKLRIKELEINKATIDQLRIKQLEIDNLKDLCAQLRARSAELEARPPVVKEKIVYKSLDGAGYVPPSSMRLIQSGDSCDERVFSGMVTKGALEASGGNSVDVLELHRRAGKSMAYKAKRLRVDAASGLAIPMVWEDGSCVRKYSEQSLTEAELRTLLSTSESLRSTTVSDIAKKNFGAHLTEGVYVIYPIN